MSLKDRLKLARQRRGLTQAALADHFGVTSQAVSQWERGDSTPESDKFAPLAELLNVDLSWLLTEGGDANLPPAEALPGLREPASPYHHDMFGARDFPVYSSAEGDDGTMVVSTDAIEKVQRPWFMRDVRDGYAVLIVGESMEPAFAPGDIAIVNPRLPPMRHRDSIFISREGHGEFTATIKRLERWTQTDWHVRQFNPPSDQKADFKLARSEWPKALRVVGKLSL
jgi:transcriptional regulator with XRE-family HTH domain